MHAAAPRFARYAVYWSPDVSDPLADFGARWLGHDPASGPENGNAPVRRLRLGLDDAFADRVTAEPRTYGLHATLKAPFRLGQGVSENSLAAAIEKVATETRTFTTAPLALTALKGFLALCPRTPSPTLNALAARCTTELDPFRAPLTDDDRARRKPATLTEVQRELLERWGYPYVLGEFRFHITLTGRLTAQDRARVEPVLGVSVMPYCSSPFSVTGISLFGDPGGGAPFELVQRYALAST